MSVSRRRFLHNSALAAAACAAAPLYAWSSRHPNIDGETNHRLNPHNSNRTAFEGLVGSSFKVSPTSGTGSPVWLRLAAVEDLPPLAPVNTAAMAVPPKPTTFVATTGFMLAFIGPGTRLPQGTYLFEHHSLGQFPLLIVPGAPGQGSYTAVFNQLIGSAPVHVPARGPIVPGGSGHDSGVTPMGSSVAPSESESRPSGSHPSQQQVEPGPRNRLEPKLPE